MFSQIHLSHHVALINHQTALRMPCSCPLFEKKTPKSNTVKLFLSSKHLIVQLAVLSSSATAWLGVNSILNKTNKLQSNYFVNTIVVHQTHTRIEEQHLIVKVAGLCVLRNAVLIMLTKKSNKKKFNVNAPCLLMELHLVYSLAHYLRKSGTEHLSLRCWN